ncbi:hypothetical protein QUB63_34120 [Microcoleus sp. ARI1-B5]
MSQNQQQPDRLSLAARGCLFLLYCLCSNTFSIFFLTVCKGSW